MIGPTSPEPIVLASTIVTGSTPKLEFVRKTSSASSTSPTEIIRGSTSIPFSCALSSTNRRVMPGRTGLDSDTLPGADFSSPRAIGVMSTLSFTMNALLTHPPAR